MLPFRDPIGYGRSRAGVSEATTIQTIPTATRASAAPAAAARRRRPLATPSHISPSAGSGISASESLTLNATPTKPAATSTHRNRRVRRPRTVAQSAATRSAIITESIVSLRDVTTEIGRTASPRPEIRAAGRPKAGRTVRKRRPAAMLPPSASGTSSAVVLKPISFVDATWSQRSIGGLSTAIRPPGSSAPKKKLCHERPMLRTAAS